MPKKKNKNEKHVDIKVGDISEVSGEVSIAGGNIKKYQTSTDLSAAEVKQLFDQIYLAIEVRPETPAANKEDLKAEVEEIQSTVTEAMERSEMVEESFLSRRFRNIARMAPDILDVVVETLKNPLAGLGITVKKIAEKAKEETKTS